ncbi:MAG: EpsG family protein, partial [Parasporobacterium sp.]|nr:EpsG family protein [Parasporobacterium sp.]
IFTVFFILLGSYAYLNRHDKRFILFFAIAITFKYQAVLYFIVLLLLREKRILRILLNMILVALPTAVMILVYYPSDAFKNSVLNFGALTYVDTGVNLGGLRPINIFLLVLILLYVFAYIKTPEDEQNEIQWGLFLLNGVSFAFFGFVYFHPQWIIICAPFVLISVIRCRYSKMLYIVQNILIIALYFISVQSWSVNIDQQMMAYGVLKKFIPGQWTTVMADYFSYDNQVYLFTAIFAILLLFVVFSHPKFMQKDITVFEPDTMLNARIVFVVAFLAWCIPAFLCLKNTIDASKTAEASYTVSIETGGETADIGTLINNVSDSI